MQEFTPEKLTEFINGKNQLGRHYLMLHRGRFRIRITDSPKHLLSHLLENGNEVGLFVEFTPEQLAGVSVELSESAV